MSADAAPVHRMRGIWAFRIIAALVVALCLLPLVAVALAAVTGSGDTVASLAQTVLGRYAGTTLALVVLVGGGALVLGTTTAWLVTMCEFPGRRWLEIALVLPLAFPAYVLAYAYTHVLDHPGIVQSLLRDVTGWGPRDYWFPEIRSLGGAALMLTLVLYPYVYLLARAAFLQQSASAFIAARALGKGPVTAFLKVSLPMARPAIASGVLLAVMETIADYGTVAYFGVQTYATGIYSSWITFADRGAAAQLALGLLAFALLLVVLDHLTRGGGRQHQLNRRQEVLTRMTLRGRARVFAWVATGLPVLLGAALPVLILVDMAIGSGQDLLGRRYMRFLASSVSLAAIAAGVTMAAAIALSYYDRLFPGRGSRGALTVARLGYAVPGGVIAVGLMVPFAAFDNALDGFMRDRFGIATGLLFTGSILLMVGAYVIRFMAAGLGAYRGGQVQLNPNMDAAARSLGARPMGVLARIHLPILTPSILTGALIVFVDVMKELPATLILRPLGWDTLAVQAFRLASDERLEGAAVPSLVIVAVGLLPVLLICRQVGLYRR